MLRLQLWAGFIIFGFAGSFVLGNDEGTDSPIVQPPNIVMVFADDWGRYASAYAKLEPGGVSDVMKTPNFDSVAKQGLLFTHAFVSAPSCTPCRSSLLSGQHFWRCGRASILRPAIWDFSNLAYPLILRDNGYRIGHTYKVWGPGSPADAPHGGAATRFDSAGRKFNQFSQNVSKAKDVSKAKESLLEEVRQNFLSFIDYDVDGELDGDKPFCYWLGPTNTHRKWIAGSGKKLAGIDPDKLRGKLPPYLPDVPTIREDFADYLGEVEAVDAALGVVVEELKRLDLDENTILVVSGDHGIPGITRGKCNLYDLGTQVPLAIRWPAGIKKPGRVISDFVSLPDLAPTFLEAANVQVPDAMTARSLHPIFTSDQSGVVDSKRDAVFTGRERHVDSARVDGKPYPQRSIRTNQFLYIINFEPERWPMGNDNGIGESVEKLIAPEYAKELVEDTFAAYSDLDAGPTKSWIIMHRRQDPESFNYAVGKRPRQELYDVLADPHCMNNLAKDIESSETLNRLHSRLMEELQRTGDSRVDSDPMFEHSPYTDIQQRIKR